MKHSIDDGLLQSNLLQAFQKNKLIQGKLNERYRRYYVQLMKDMQDYQLKEKLNKELLYTWKKENYVRQIKNNLKEYEKKRFGVIDAHYEYQVRNLECVITGQQGLAIPPKEEERRLNVNAKLQQFLDDHPLQTTSSMRSVQAIDTTVDQEKQRKEEEDARGVHETWKHIHAQSAAGLKRRQRNILPSIQRSSTMDEIRRNKPPIRNLVLPTTAALSDTLAATVLEVVHPPAEPKRQPVFTDLSARSALLEDMEPVQITSEILQKETRGDLVAMRSVRRPQKNPIDLNITFESRKRIYQINKRLYEYQLCPRKCGLQHNSQFDRPQTIDPVDDDENLLVEMSETSRRRYEDRHQADKSFI